MSATAAGTLRHPLTRALLVLTFTTGLVDAVSFLGLGHVFTTNMIGNIVLLGGAPRRGIVERGAPTRIRTWGLLLRRESLYPTELSGLVALHRESC
jgi:hypothetical protein